MINRISQQKGITLVALVITIILLLILAGITISSLGGDNGLLSRAKKAKRAQIEQEMQETLALALQEIQIDKVGEATLGDITQEWLDETIKKYKCTIEEEISQDKRRIIMEQDGVICEYIIDEKLNIINANNGIENISEFSYAVLDNTDNSQIKLLITVKNVEDVEYLELPNKDKIYVNELEQISTYYNVSENSEHIFKIKKSNGEEVSERVKINESFIKNTTLSMKADVEIKGYRVINVQKKIKIENYDNVYYKLSEHGEWIEGTKFSMVDYDLIQNGTVEEDGTATIFAKVVNSQNNDQVIISNKVKVDMTQVNQATQSMQGESLLKILEENELKTGKYEVTVENEKYNLKLYNLEENVRMSADTTFGVEEDVGAEDVRNEAGEIIEHKYAQNMIVVKVNGNLSIEDDVKLTSYASKDGYGGTKGMLVYCTGTLTNRGTISMTARGAKAEGQNVYLWKNTNYKNDDEKFEYIPKIGANGGDKSYAPSYSSALGNVGENGLNRQTRWRRIWLCLVWR